MKWGIFPARVCEMAQKKKETLEQRGKRLKRPSKGASKPSKKAAPSLFDGLEVGDDENSIKPVSRVIETVENSDTTLIKNPEPGEEAVLEPDLPTEPEDHTPVGEEQPMTVGAYLRIARINAGLDVDQVAEALRLRPFQVKAIEESKYDLLPGKTFVTGFLRSYANLLNLDSVDVVQMFRDEDAGNIESPALYFPEPAEEGRMPGFGLLIAAGLGAVAIFGGWNYYQMRTAVKLEYVETVPEHLAIHANNVDTPAITEGKEYTTRESEEEPALQSPLEMENLSDVASIIDEEETVKLAPKPDIAVDEAPQIDENTDLQTMESGPEPDAVTAIETETEMLSTPDNMAKEKTVPETKLPVEVAAVEDIEESDDISSDFKKEEVIDDVPVLLPTAKEVTKKTSPDDARSRKLASADIILQKPEPEALGLENTGSRIVVVANQESWVQIYSETGTAILTRIFRPGDSFMVPDQPNLKLMTGNAGGLQIRVDGKNVRSLGEKGAILKDFDLVAENLLNKVETSN
jgi:cytoskeleton protein RodZ